MEYTAERIMIGGIIIEVVSNDAIVYIDVADTTYPRTTCAIMVKATPLSDLVEFGDRIWWQGDKAFWTPCDDERRELARLCQDRDYDFVLERKGPSGWKLPGRGALRS